METASKTGSYFDILNLKKLNVHDTIENPAEIHIIKLPPS